LLFILHAEVVVRVRVSKAFSCLFNFPSEVPVVDLSWRSTISIDEGAPLPHPVDINQIIAVTARFLKLDFIFVCLVSMVLAKIIVDKTLSDRILINWLSRHNLVGMEEQKVGFFIHNCLELLLRHLLLLLSLNRLKSRWGVHISHIDSANTTRIKYQLFTLLFNFSLAEVV